MSEEVATLLVAFVVVQVILILSSFAGGWSSAVQAIVEEHGISLPNKLVKEAKRDAPLSRTVMLFCFIGSLALILGLMHVLLNGGE